MEQKGSTDTAVVSQVIYDGESRRLISASIEKDFIVTVVEERVNAVLTNRVLPLMQQNPQAPKIFHTIELRKISGASPDRQGKREFYTYRLEQGLKIIKVKIIPE